MNTLYVTSDELKATVANMTDQGFRVHVYYCRLVGDRDDALNTKLLDLNFKLGDHVLYLEVV